MSNLIWNDLSTRNSVLSFFFHSCSSQEAAQVAVEEAITTINHSDIRGSEPHNRDPSGAASDSGATASAPPASAAPADAAPVATAHADAAPPSAPPAQPPQGLSRDFASAAITALAEMREMRGAVRAMITYGLAVSDTWTQDDQGRVMTGLRQAEVAASTDADLNALQLLQNEADQLASWADEVFAARQVLNGAKTVDPNALQNDPALAKIRSCGQFLNAMLVSGSFADDPSCH